MSPKHTTMRSELSSLDLTVGFLYPPQFPRKTHKSVSLNSRRAEVQGRGSDITPGGWRGPKPWDQDRRLFLWLLYSLDSSTFLSPGPQPVGDQFTIRSENSQTSHSSSNWFYSRLESVHQRWSGVEFAGTLPDTGSWLVASIINETETSN